MMGYRALLLTISLSFLCQCTGGRVGDPIPGQETITNQIVGRWTSSSFETQFGIAVEAYCFKTDGTVLIETKTQAGVLRNSGRYFVEGNTLTLEWPGGAQAIATISWDATQLVLKFEDRGARHYSPDANSC